MRKNRTKAKIKAGEPTFGVVLRIPSPAVLELCAHAGYDYVLIDTEGQPTNDAVCEDLVRAAEASGITPLVMVHTLNPKVISRFLGTGALGVQIPHLTSKEEALEAVRYAKYYPEGQRCMGSTRAVDYGVKVPATQYVEEVNREVMIVAHIEDVEGVENLDEILTVQGIDVVCFGPGDLSQSLGLPGQVEHPKVQETIEQIIAKVRDSDKALGVPGVDVETTRRYLDQGALYVAMRAEAFLFKAAREYLEMVKGPRA